MPENTTKWLLMVYCLLQGVIIMTKSINTIYTRTGENVLINCSDQKALFWRFGENDQIVAECMTNGKSIEQINTNLVNYLRLNITSNCDLQIQNFSEEDVGIYQCFHAKKDITGGNKYEINIQLQNIKILEANNVSIIKGIEGEQITLTCTFQGAFSDETLYFTKDGKVLNSGKPPSLVHTFKACAVDNNKEIVCKLNNNQNSHILKASVKMNFILKPLISVHAVPSLVVMKGQHIELICKEKLEGIGNIDCFLWKHNGVFISNNKRKLIFQNADPNDAGEYVCIAKNVAGEHSFTVNVTINFSPVVQEKQYLVPAKSPPITLECKVTGVPNNYTFNEWRHYTFKDQLIRTIHGNDDGTLNLPEGDRNEFVYEDSGVYLCNVSNGIADDDGDLWKLGKMEVVVEGRPVLTKPKKQIYIGRYNETSSIKLFVLSSTNVLEATWFENKTLHHNTKPCISCMTQANFFEMAVNISAYKCEYEIQKTKEEDFQNYTVEINNHFGTSTFKVLLMSARRPEQPTIIRWHPSRNHILVEFKPGFNGGYHQRFIAEYRKIPTGKWKWLEVKNLDRLIQVYYINNLEPSTRYEYRMFAQNVLGNSTVTENYNIFTKDENSRSGTEYIGFALGLSIPACLLVIWWRFRKGKKNHPHRSVANEQQIQGGGQLVNNLYGSAVDLQGSSPATACRADAYSSIDRNRQNVDSQEVSYKIAGERKKKEFQLAGRKDRKERGSSKLNYIDVVFESKPHIGKFYIHGDDNRTPYADIDFSAKAEPLISSDEDDESSINGKNNCDDFVSLEDVQQWNVTED